MVDKVRLLERLADRFSCLADGLTLLREEDYHENHRLAEKTLFLMRQVYEKVKETHATHPLVQRIERFYGDAWDVSLPPHNYREAQEWAL